MLEEIKYDIAAWKERGRTDEKLWREQIAARMAEVSKIGDIRKRYRLKNEIGVSDYDLNMILKGNYFATQRRLLDVRPGENAAIIKSQIRLAYYQKRAEVYEKHLLKGSLELGKLQKQVRLQNEVFMRSFQDRQYC